MKRYWSKALLAVGAAASILTHLGIAYAQAAGTPNTAPTVPSQTGGEVQAVFGRPPDISLDGHRSDWLFDVTAISVTVLFIIMLIIIGIALAKHRESHHAHYEHGIGQSHLVFTAIISSIIFFGVDGTLLYNAYVDLHDGFYKFPTDAENPVRIEVLAQQWAWNIRYPGADGKFGTADDLVTLNDMRIPVGRPVLVKLRSNDVIHSFYLPNFRTKQDAVPGTTTRIWFQATKPGVVEIGCAQHCGASHYKMRGQLTVAAADQFEAWQKEAADTSARAYDANDTDAQWGWDWETK